MIEEPKIIAHRGRSDIFPQNTIQAIQNGLLIADLAQFDVLLTKDNQLIVFHDRYLSKLTNIADIQAFANRKTVENLDQFGTEPHLEWWVKDFTLQQIQTLEVHQKNQKRPQIKTTKFKIPTLQQLLKHCLQLKKVNFQKQSGILLQIKSERQNLIMSQKDWILLQKIKECLQKSNLYTKSSCQQNNLSIIIQSFNHELLKQWISMGSDLSVSHLYYNETHLDQEIFNQQISSRSIGIGISQTHLNERIIKICKKNDLKIFYWTVVDDGQKIPFGKQHIKDVYKHLKLMGVDGIITDFAQNCKKYLLEA